MKAIGICGSPRKNGNTEIVTGHILKAVEEEGIDTELLGLAEFTSTKASRLAATLFPGLIVPIRIIRTTESKIDASLYFFSMYSRCPSLKNLAKFKTVFCQQKPPP